MKIPPQMVKEDMPQAIEQESAFCLCISATLRGNFWISENPGGAFV